MPGSDAKPRAQARARKIKLLLFDVDGVLTDGKLFIFPAPGVASVGSFGSPARRALTLARQLLGCKKVRSELGLGCFAAECDLLRQGVAS